VVVVVVTGALSPRHEHALEIWAATNLVKRGGIGGPARGITPRFTNVFSSVEVVVVVVVVVVTVNSSDSLIFYLKEAYGL
jgi:hypothetical protein